MNIERELKKAILALIEKVMEKVLREYFEMCNEKWVKGKELGENIRTFSTGWLKLYGSSLPRTQPIVVDKNNVEHECDWVYPLHRIQRMMMNGEIKELRVGEGIAEKGRDMSE